MVWAIIGTGARVVQHETIQSSADAAAFSAAVIKAKGLNIIAFCNLVMALLLALVMLLRAIKYVLIGLAVVVSICAAVPVIVQPARAGLRRRVAPDLDEFAGQHLSAARGQSGALHQDRDEGAVGDRARGRARSRRSWPSPRPITSAPTARTRRTSARAALVTVAWPLPIEGLPVKDGTCKDLADNAMQYIADIASLIINKILGVLHVPSFIAGWSRRAIEAVVAPLAGTLCGGSSTVDVAVKKTSTDCSTCQSAKNVKLSTWSGKQVWRNSDMPQDQWKGSNPGSINHMVDGTCQMQSMPGWSCPGSGSTIGSSMVSCASDTTGKQWQGMQFQSCVYQDTEQQKVTGESDWPPPLVFADDWESKVDRRARSPCSTTATWRSGASRSRSAAKASERDGAAPLPYSQMMGMAAGRVDGVERPRRSVAHGLARAPGAVHLRQYRRR